MPIKVKVPETDTVINFPDDTPEQEMASAVEQHIREYKNTQTAKPVDDAPLIPADKPRGANPMNVAAPDAVAREMQYPKQNRPVPRTTMETAKGMFDLLPGLAGAGAEWSKKPLVNTQGAISNYFDNPYLKGAASAVEEAAGGFTSPLNIGLLVGLRKAPGSVQKAASAAFGVDMGANAVSQAYRAYQALKENDPYTMSKELVHAILGTGMAGAAFGHAKSPVKEPAPVFTDRAKANIIAEEKQYQALQDSYRNPQPKPMQVIEPGSQQFYSEGQIEPVGKPVVAKVKAVKGKTSPIITTEEANTSAVVQPKAISQTTGKPALVPQIEQPPVLQTEPGGSMLKPLDKFTVPEPQPPTEAVTAKTAESTAEGLRPELESASKAIISSGDQYRLATTKSNVEVQPPTPDRYATEWGVAEPETVPETSRSALTPVEEAAPVPAAKSSILQPDSEVISTAQTKPEMAETSSAENKTLTSTAASTAGRLKPEFESMLKPEKPKQATPAPTTEPPINKPKSKSTPQPDSSLYMGSLFGALQSLYDRAASGNLTNKSLADIARESKKLIVEKTRKGALKVEEKMLDYAIPARTMDEASGVDLSKPKGIEDSVWIAMRMHPGAVHAAARQIYKIDRLAKTQAKELRALGKQQGLDNKTSKDLFKLQATWSIARHLVTDIAKNEPDYDYPEPGYTLEGWQKIMKDIEDKVGPAITSAFETNANALRDKNWDILYNTQVKPYWLPEGTPGMMSEKQMADMQAKYPNYVPLNRLFDEIAPDNSNYYKASGKFSTPNMTNIKNLKGGSKAEVADIIGSMYRGHMQAVDLASRNSVVQKVANTWAGESSPMKGTVKQVADWYTPARNEHRLAYKEDGVTKYVVVPRDMAPMFERMDRHKVNKLVEVIGKFTHVLTGNVTADPLFWANNLQRDFGTFNYTLQNGTSAPAPKTLHKYFESLSDAALRGLTNSADEAHMRYLESFGGGSGLHEYLRYGPGREGQISRLANPSTVKEALTSPWRAYTSVGETFELATKLAAQRMALENGESLYVSGWRARTGIVDFDSHGASELMNSLRYIVPFLNPRMQGVRTLLTTAGETAKGLPGGKQVANWAGMQPSRLTKAGVRNAGIVGGTIFTLALWSQLHNLITAPDAYKDTSKDKLNNYLVWLRNTKDADGQYKTWYNYPISEFQVIKEAGAYLGTLMVYHNPDAAAELLNTFYGAFGAKLPVRKPKDRVKPDGRGAILRGLNSLSPISAVQDDQPSLREFLSNARGVTQVPDILATGIDLRKGTSYDSYPYGFQRDRIETKTRPSAVLLSEGVNKAADYLQGNPPKNSLEWQKIQDSAWRSPNVLQGAVERATGQFPLNIGDSLIHGANNLTVKSPTDKPLFRDPAVEAGQTPKGYIDRAIDRYFRAAPSRFDSDAAALTKAKQMEHESENRKVADAANRVVNLLRNKKVDEARQFLQQVDGEIDPADKTSRKLLADKLRAGIKQLKIEQGVENFNEANPENRMGNYTRNEMQLKRQSAAVRAAVFYERMKDLNDEQKAALAQEWKAKGLFSGKFKEELVKVIGKQKGTSAAQTGDVEK